jgi:hypothetical protein
MTTYRSHAQRRWANSPDGRKALGRSCRDMNRECKGKPLPERVNPVLPGLETTRKDNEK